MTLEQRAFFDAQPAYEQALAKAQALGAPPAHLNALLAPEAFRVEGLTFYSLTLGGYLLLSATDNAWLKGGETTSMDAAMVILALMEPEWARGHVSFTKEGDAIVDRAALTDRLLKIAETVPAPLWPELLECFNNDLQILRAGDDDDDEPEEGEGEQGSSGDASQAGWVGIIYHRILTHWRPSHFEIMFRFPLALAFAQLAAQREANERPGKGPTWAERHAAAAFEEEERKILARLQTAES